MSRAVGSRALSRRRRRSRASWRKNRQFLAKLLHDGRELAERNEENRAAAFRELPGHHDLDRSTDPRQSKAINRQLVQARLAAASIDEVCPMANGT